MRNFFGVATSLVVFLFLSLHALSQENYTNGFVVTLSGDTLKGQIDYRNWDKNPTTVHFLPTHSPEKRTTYTAKDIHGFGVSTTTGLEIYRSAFVGIIVNSLDFAKLENSSQPRWDSTSLFLLLLEDGRLPLYKFTGTNARVHFFIEPVGQKPVELLYHTYTDENGALYYNAAYKQQLQVATADCSSLQQSMTEHMDYAEKPIVKLVNKYNHCKNQTSFSFRKEKSPVHFSVIGGVNLISLNTEGFTPLDILQYSLEVNPTVGVALQFMLPRQGGKLSFLLEGLLKFQNMKGTGVNYTDEQRNITYTLNIEATYARLNALCRYSFVKSRLKPFLQAGIGNGFALSLKNTLQEADVFYSSTRNKTSTLAILERKNEQGLIFGSGISRGPSTVEARIETSNGFAKGAFAKSGVKTFSLLYSYTL